MNATGINPVEFCLTFHYMHSTRASASGLQVLDAVAVIITLYMFNLFTAEQLYPPIKSFLIDLVHLRLKCR